MRRLPAVALVLLAVAVAAPRPTSACTGFCALGKDGHVLVGNNEDWFNPRTRLRFVPATPGAYGRMYTGFDDGWPQGGMNERGLWYDAFAAPPLRASSSAHLPSYPGNIVDAAMAQCATVEEVIQLISRYNRSYLSEGILMFADASGDAVSIEANAIVRKKGAHFVQTNFHQSRGLLGGGLDRYQTASSMLEGAGGNISADLFRSILAATHQEGPGPTVYSNVYDLTSRTMTLYHFHDFSRGVTFRLDEELKKGERVVDIRSLFPLNAQAEALSASLPQAVSGFPEPLMALSAVIGVVILGLVVVAVRGGRRIRIGLGVAAACVVAPAALVIGLLLVEANTHGPKSKQWIQFHLAPATGDNAHVNPTTVRGNGLTLRRLIAEAYGFPAVRVVGPAWLSDTRYTIDATVGLDDQEQFRALLQEELAHHLNLQSHVEVRPYDGFVLQSTGESRLPRGTGDVPAIRINKVRAEFRNAEAAHLTDALQLILGKPVVDRTGLSGRYDFELAWENPPLADVTATLRDRFGLELTPSRVDLETLVVDRVRRDPAMFLLAQASRLARLAPASVRDRIGKLSID